MMQAGIGGKSYRSVLTLSRGRSKAKTGQVETEPVKRQRRAREARGGKIEEAAPRSPARGRKRR